MKEAAQITVKHSSAADLRHKLVVHVHVPKTAGSSINYMLKQTLGDGSNSLHHLVKQPPARLKDVVSKSNWIAGHLPFDKCMAAVKNADREVYVVCSLREPKKHVASHYNWLIEIGHRGPLFFRNHPKPIQEMHHRIVATDNSDPLQVIENLRRFPGMFLNSQSRYAVGAGWGNHATSFREALKRYDFIAASSSDIADFGRLIGFDEEDVALENVSGYHFDRTVFDTPEMEDFLFDMNRADNALWTIAGSLKVKLDHEAT